MSSRAFAATTSHSPNDPQLCGLHNVTGCCADIDGEEFEGAIRKGQRCFYLTCRGDAALPERQIQGSKKKDGYDTGYRQTPSGQYREVGSCRKGHQSQKECEENSCGSGRWWKKKLFKWQEWRCPNNCGKDPVACGRSSHGGGWHDVQVWERMVHVGCAIDAGYRVPAGETMAHKGNRTKGLAHRVSKLKENPMMDLARILDEED